VAAVAHQEGTDPIECGDDVEFGDTAGTAAADLLSLFDNDCRAVELITQLPRGQSHDSGLKFFAGDDQNRRSGWIQAGDLSFGDCIGFGRERLALLVEAFQTGCHFIGCLVFITAQEVIGQPGAGQTTGGIDAGSDAKADCCAVDRSGRHRGHFHEREQPHTFALAQFSQPPPHQRAIFALQGHQIGDGADGHQVEKGLLLGRRLVL